MSDEFDVESEVAFAALGGWEEAFKDALQRYCDYCRSLPPSEQKRRHAVLLDFDLWTSPLEAAGDRPFRGMSIAAAARFLAERVKRHATDPYALLGSIDRECKK